MAKRIGSIRSIAICILFLVFYSCSDVKSDSLFPLEGSWYILEIDTQELKGTERYSELYFSKELLCLNDWLAVSDPIFYRLSNDSLYISDTTFYFRLIENYNDSVILEFYNGERKRMKRMNSTEKKIKSLKFESSYVEDLFLQRMDRAMVKLENVPPN